jgi:ADP-ribosyl-[dinitrogen reductase] hydrolase
MIGAIAGDIIGSVHEFTRNRCADFPLFVQASSPTDDTLLTCAVARACLDRSADYRGRILEAFRLAESRPCAASIGPGWGVGFRDWASEGGPGVRESFGNGAAMRVSAVGWSFGSREEVLAQARLSALPSHAHPEGVRGAQCAALAVFLARTTGDPSAVRRATEAFYGHLPGLDGLRRGHVYDESCQVCVPAALAIATETRDYESCVRAACSIGGDADTLAAIAGAVAEALWGVPPAIAAEAMARLEACYPWAAATAREGVATWGVREGT